MITDLTEARKKRDKLRFAEISTHDEYGYLSTSIWNAIELKESLWHTTRGEPTRVIYGLINRIILGEELVFKEGEITTLFRIATDEDIKKANEDDITFQKELDDFSQTPHDTTFEKAASKLLGLDDENT